MATIAALLIACALAAPACASWTPRPLNEYSVGLPGRGQEQGIREFRHHERHVLDDGSDLELHWEVHTDPATILALDLEHPHGLHVVECGKDSLLLHVPEPHLQRVSSWRHVTASEAVHGCSHLDGMNLYHRINSVESVVAQAPPQTGSLVRLSTEELPSPSHVFPHMRFSFRHFPIEARDPEDEDEEEEEDEISERRLGLSFSSGKPTMQNSFTPVASSTNSVVNFNVPKELSNLSWNWDYHANSTENPQFKYTYPGGLGYMRLYQPYLKSHFGITMNFSSSFHGVTKVPHTRIQAELKGYADFNADVATAMVFNTDHSASVLDNILDHLDNLKLPKVMKNFKMPNSVKMLTPLKFFMGGTPMSLKPHFQCRMKAYHIGQLKGSLRVGLATKLLLHGTMNFDTQTGLKTDFSARSLDVRFTPPSWMIYTQHFELGIMLEPTLFLSGMFGQGLEDMQIGMGFRPYLNVSIMENNGQSPDTAPLAVYPFRMIGLPTGRSYAVEVRVNDQAVRTVSQISIGMTQFYDSVEDFQFGLVQHKDLNVTDIVVAIIEDGVEVGSSVTHCVTTGLLGECHAAEMQVAVRVGNATAVVQLTGYWEPSAAQSLKKKVKSIGMQFEMITVNHEIADTLEKVDGALDGARLVLRHSGQTISVPLSKGHLDSTMILESKMIYELGPIFLNSWKYASSRGKVKDPLQPIIDIVVLGKVVATGPLPVISWDHQDAFSGMGSIAAGAGSFKASVTTIPVTAPLYPPDDEEQKTMLGTAKVSFNTMPAGKAAYIISPSEAETLKVGSTYRFRWTVSGFDDSKTETFYISAKIVKNTGWVTELNWLVTVKAKCSTTLDVDLGRWLGETADPCIFEADITIPEMVGGHRGVIVVNWMDQEINPYEMITPLVDFVKTGRRLNSNAANASSVVSVGRSRRMDSANAKQWGGKALGSTTSNTFGPKVRKKLHKLASHCSSTPLKYSVNAGMNMVEIMKGIMMPGTSMVGSMSKPATGDWSSNPMPLFMLGGKNQSKHSHKFSSLLPKELCEGGVCEGMMPGCQRDKVNTENIDKIELKLSRKFKWKKHVGPKIRHVVAYALALLPSSLEIGGEQLEEQQRLAATTTTTTVASTIPVTTATTTTSTLAETTTTVPTTRSTTAATTAAPALAPTTVAPVATAPARLPGAAARAPVGVAPTVPAGSAAMPTSSEAPRAGEFVTLTTEAPEGAFPSASATSARSSAFQPAQAPSGAAPTSAASVAPQEAAARVAPAAARPAPVAATAAPPTLPTSYSPPKFVPTPSPAQPAAAAPEPVTAPAAPEATAAPAINVLAPSAASPAPASSAAARASPVAASAAPAMVTAAPASATAAPVARAAPATATAAPAAAARTAAPASATAAPGARAAPATATAPPATAARTAVPASATAAPVAQAVPATTSAAPAATARTAAPIAATAAPVARATTLLPAAAAASASAGVPTAAPEQSAAPSSVAGESTAQPQGQAAPVDAEPAGFEWVMPFDVAAPRRLKGDRNVGRWEVETDDGGVEGPEDRFEFDTFTVRLREPIHYELTESLLQRLFDTGAFRGIEDGREATHGPVRIERFRLLPSSTASTPAPAVPKGVAAPATFAQVLADGGEALYERSDHRQFPAFRAVVARGRGWLSSTALGAAAACASLLGALAVAAAAARRRGYERLAQRQQAQDGSPRHADV